MDEMRQFELYLQEEKVLLTAGEQRMLGETMTKIIKQAFTVPDLGSLTKEDAMLSKIPLGYYYRIQKAAGGFRRWYRRNGTSGAHTVPRTGNSMKQAQGTSAESCSSGVHDLRGISEGNKMTFLSLKRSRKPMDSRFATRQI